MTSAQEPSSTHGWVAAETLSLGRKLAPEDLPERIFIIGVEAVQFTLGEGLSPAVRNAIPEAVEMINEILGEVLKSNRKGLFAIIFKRLGIR